MACPSMAFVRNGSGNNPGIQHKDVTGLLRSLGNCRSGHRNTFVPMLSGIMEFVMRTGSALVLPMFIGSRGILYAEVLAWIGADLILLPVFFHTFRKMEKK